MIAFWILLGVVACVEFVGWLVDEQIALTDYREWTRIGYVIALGLSIGALYDVGALS